MRRISMQLGLLVVSALIVPGTAAAQAHHASPNSAGALPFTGLDVLLLLAGIAALLTAGLVVRRVAGRLT